MAALAADLIITAQVTPAAACRSMSKPRHIADVRALAARALARGADITRPGVITWNAHGRCENPRVIEHYGNPATLEVMEDAWGEPELVPSRKRVYAGPRASWRPAGHDYISGATPMWVDMSVKCRRCPSCLRDRSREWAHRANLETAGAQRTWFGTLTLRPEMHERVLNLCRKRLRVRAELDFDTLSQEEQFRERVGEIGKEITLWLKRIRKNSGATLRYILVAEAHKTGLPHLHLLVHEVPGSKPVTYSQLTAAWNWGFTQFKLVDATRSPAWYVCKYLAKSALSRVRASVRYGKTP